MNARRVAILLTAIAVIRIASTYGVFSQTADEPAHVAAGMELLTQHRYTLHIDNTPLPRLLLALPAWLHGNDYEASGDIVQQGNRVLESGGRYRTNLALVRAPNLIFFLIAIFATWRWTLDLLGPSEAALAVLFVSTQPVVMGHAGLATTDVAAMAGIGVALYAAWRFLDNPSLRMAAAFGAAYGFAINCKLSAIAFVPAGAIAMLVARVASRRFTMPRPAAIGTFLAAAFVVTWAGYGFTTGRVDGVAVPAPKLFLGLETIVQNTSRGTPAYLFGRSSVQGWWWYFPATIALKATIGSLAAAAVGVTRKRVVDPAAAAAGMLAYAMTTHINQGVRHVLPLFIPLSIVAAAAIVWLVRSEQLPLRAAAVILLAWHIAAGAIAHPDYFAYFNETVRDPAADLLDSNLDWGQDLLRLEHELRARHVQQVGLKYFGSADLVRRHLPRWTEARRDQPMTGWVAISEMWYHGVWYDGYHDHAYPWLESRKPVAIVGKSIRLYFIR